jgi:hydroxyethylthiazole kinase-like sugar kinase family protein
VSDSNIRILPREIEILA